MSDPSPPDPDDDRDPGEDRDHVGDRDPDEGAEPSSDDEREAVSSNGRDSPGGTPPDTSSRDEVDREADPPGDGPPDEPAGEPREERRELTVTSDDGPTADTSREVRHANPDPHPGDHTPADEPEPGPAGWDPKQGVDGRDPDDHGPRGPRGPDVGGTTDRTDPDTLKWLSGIVALVGAWIAASPFVYGAGAAALWNNVAVGVAILLLAGYNFYRVTDGLAPNVGGSSLVALLGVWSVVAPMLLPFASEPLAWSTMASGAAIAVLSGYHAYETRRTAPAAAPGSQA